MKRKIFKIIAIMILLISIFINVSYASVVEDLGGNLDNYSTPLDQITAPDNFVDKVGIVISIIQNVGVVISVIVLIIIGFKYMLGSLEERAEYKKSMIPYLVGAILVFSISTIPQIIYTFVKDL